MEVWELASILGLAHPSESATAPAPSKPDPDTWGTDPQAQASMRAMMAAMPRGKRR